jgi:hypothetical protein
MHVAQNRGQWRTLVNTVNELLGPLQAGEFLDWLSN